jgi:hypothetical protein
MLTVLFKKEDTHSPGNDYSWPVHLFLVLSPILVAVVAAYMLKISEERNRR